MQKQYLRKNEHQKNEHHSVLIAVTQKQLYFDFTPNGLLLSFLLPPVMLILIFRKSASLNNNNKTSLN